MSLFYFFGGDGADRAGLGGGCIPRRWRPQPQRTRKACTSQAAVQAVPKPGRTNTRADHARHDTHVRTLDTLHREIGTAAGAGGLAARPKLCRFGHNAAAKKYISFLNTFVARATESPFTMSQKCDIIMSQE